MRILVTESTPSGALVPGALLALDGHDVVFCHPAGADGSAAPCVGLAAGGRCPLRDGQVELVVDVRADGGPFALREAGALCALGGGTPLIIAGRPPAGSTLVDEATAICDPDQLVRVCAEAMALTGPAMHRAVVEAVTSITSREGVRPEVRLAEVDDTLHVYVYLVHEPTEILIEEIRRAAWLASTRTSRGRVDVVAHVVSRMRTAGNGEAMEHAPSGRAVPAGEAEGPRFPGRSALSRAGGRAGR